MRSWWWDANFQESLWMDTQSFVLESLLKATWNAGTTIAWNQRLEGDFYL